MELTCFGFFKMDCNMGHHDFLFLFIFHAHATPGNAVLVVPPFSSPSPTFIVFFESKTPLSGPIRPHFSSFSTLIQYKPRFYIDIASFVWLRESLPILFGGTVPPDPPTLCQCLYFHVIHTCMGM